MSKIEQFRGEHRFLSNMYMLENWIKSPTGLAVPTVEHGYQAEKFADEKVQEAIAFAHDGNHAKKLAHYLIEQGEAETHPDYDEKDRKLGVMRYWVRQKFTTSLGLGDKLAATGDVPIIEGNTWGDRFWGVDPPGSANGSNHLGRLLMEVRSELQEARKR